MALRPAYVDLLLSGQWTDITPRVYIGDGITITRGQSPNGQTVDPGTCTMTINNRSGDFSPRNPIGQYYGQIGRNTPVRVSVAAGTPWLGLTDDYSPDMRVSTPDAAALDITGDLDLRFDIAPADWSSGNVVELGGKLGATGNQSWYLILFSGVLQLLWSANGTATISATSSAITAQAGSRMSVRATLKCNNGSGGNTVTFYTAPSMGGAWTQLGNPVVNSGTTSIFNSTAPLQIGDISQIGFVNASCRMFAAEIRNGIAGTVVANPDFTAHGTGAATFTDAAGNTWTTSSAAALTNRHVRFVGEISAWPRTTDDTGKDVRSPVQGSGILRRLGKGTDALPSTLRRRLPSLGPIAYWPMEDGSTATTAASPIAGVRPMSVAGCQFAQSAGPPGSDSLPLFTLPATITASVPAPSGTPASWHIEYVLQMDTVPVSLTTMFQFTTTMSPWPVITVQLSSTQLQVIGSSLDGTATTSLLLASIGAFNGPWSRNQLIATQTGSSVDLEWAWTTIGGTTGGLGTTIASATVGHIVSINAPVGITTSLGHMAVFEPAQPGAFANVDTGFNGDSASGRVQRLCGEQSVPVTLTNGSTASGVMGPQRSSAFLDLLRECESADIGVLYEQREALGLAYRARASLYNQTPVTLDYAAKEIKAPFEPSDDDQQTLNDITVSRVNGSSARATQKTGPLSTALPPAGVGPYPDTPTLNVATDLQLPDLAGWLVHLGAWDEARYPSVRVSLDAAPAAVDRVAALDLGDRLQIANPPAAQSTVPIDLMVMGYTEKIAQTWDVMFNCLPAAPWTVGVLDDAVLGRCDTDGSTLTAGATSTATTLSVATTGTQPLWVTTALNPGEFPFDILVSGERITVGAISGTSSPQTFSSLTRSVNGVVKALPINSAVSLWQPMYVAL